MTSAENIISEPPNWKIFWERIPPDPPTRLVPWALAIMPPLPPPRYKKPSYSPDTTLSNQALEDTATFKTSCKRPPLKGDRGHFLA